jgi:hypothetical protein
MLDISFQRPSRLVVVRQANYASLQVERILKEGKFFIEWYGEPVLFT